MTNHNKAHSEKKEPIPITTVTFKLTDEDITRYREEIERFPLEKEERILGRLPDKLSAIAANRRLSTFVIDLFNDIELLFNALIKKKQIPDFSRKMILFALNYFIEVEDEIPDKIDILGYVDDAVVVRWVVDEIIRKYPEVLSDRI